MLARLCEAPGVRQGTLFERQSRQSGLTCWLKVSGRALRSSSSAVISAPEGIRLEFCREGRCEGVDRAFMSSAFLPQHTLSDGTLPLAPDMLAAKPPATSKHG